MNEMGLKISAKLLKIRALVPAKIRDLHFPPEVLMLLHSY
jgi:hypothetical protein